MNKSPMADRPRRITKVPLRYWDEYVQTDSWYLAKLLEDVPPEEMHAACEDEEFDEDEESASEMEVDDEDDEDVSMLDFIELEESLDTEYVPAAASEESSSDDDTESDAEGSTGDSSADREEDEEVHGTSEGDTGSEGAYGEGACGSVG